MACHHKFYIPALDHVLVAGEFWVLKTKKRKTAEGENIGLDALE